jgi:hypothetical protein
MTTVYLLTRQDYDEYDILGVYATEELAEAEKARHNEADPLHSYDLVVDSWDVQGS